MLEKIWDMRKELTVHSASKLQEGLEANLVAELHVPGQFIISHAMCDDIGIESSQAELSLVLTSH